tara:strand:- start:9390 stop:10844 length:1455 start_codon:yes stop_codon:yes gene_type:complete
VNRQTLLFAIAILLAICAIPYSTAAEDGSTSFLGFDEDNGVHISENASITGFLVSSVEPSPESTWSITDQASGVTLPLGSGTTSFGEPHQYGNFMKWPWEVTIDPENYGDCSCVLHLTVSYDGQDSISSSLAVFIGEPTGVILLPEYPLGDSWTRGEIEFSGWSGTNEISATLGFSVTHAGSFSETCLDGGEVDDSTLLQTMPANGPYSSMVDISGFSDGWYSAWTTTTSDIGILNHCVAIRVDNSPPISVISGSNEAQEGDEALLFDGGPSDDGFWGKGDLFHIWTVLDKSRPGSAPVSVTQGESTFSMDTDTSGEFEIGLRVVDGGGLYSSTSRSISITNVIPSVKLIVDGKSVVHGDSIRLSSDSSWEIDASESIDSPNDINGLRCVWKIDNSPVYEGCQRSFSWPENESQKLILTVEVIDDDDEYSFISVELVHPDYSDDLPLGIIVLVVSAAFLASAILFRRNSTSGSDIPKWQPDEQN